MGIIAFDSSWTLTAAGERIDWNDIKGRIDLARVVTALLGPAAKRQGRRLLWPCPFHDDRNPSFEVDPQRGTWRALSILFLFLVIAGGLVAYFYFAPALGRRGESSLPPEATDSVR